MHKTKYEIELFNSMSRGFPVANSGIYDDIYKKIQQLGDDFIDSLSGIKSAISFRSELRTFENLGFFTSHNIYQFLANHYYSCYCSDDLASVKKGDLLPLFQNPNHEFFNLLSQKISKNIDNLYTVELSQFNTLDKNKSVIEILNNNVAHYPILRNYQIHSPIIKAIIDQLLEEKFTNNPFKSVMMNIIKQMQPDDEKISTSSNPKKSSPNATFQSSFSNRSLSSRLQMQEKFSQAIDLETLPKRSSICYDQTRSFSLDRSLCDSRKIFSPPLIKKSSATFHNSRTTHFAPIKLPYPTPSSTKIISRVIDNSTFSLSPKKESNFFDRSFPTSTNSIFIPISGERIELSSKLTRSSPVITSRFP
jgi:hypothetical protein